MSVDVIVVPTYNEKEVILGHLEMLTSLYPDMEVIVVDDNSPDGTSALVENFARAHSRVSLMKREKKTGLGDAYKHALAVLVKRREVKNIYTMDADGSHDPAYIAAFSKALKTHHLAIGSRYVRGGGVVNWEFRRRFLSKFGNIYAKIILGVPVTDFTGGFMGFSREALSRLDIASIPAAGYAYQIEFKYRMIRAGASWQEVPIVFLERKQGISKMNWKIVFEGVLSPLRLRFFPSRSPKCENFRHES